MKKLIVTLGCLLITPLAFAQPSSTDKKQGTTTTEPVEVTGTIIRTMIAEGAAGSQKNWEWFQWLAEQIDRHSKARTSLTLGAHDAYRDWRP